jgi:hypothetical protein
MDLETWTKLFGKTQDDPAVKAALGTAGVKKVPKLDEDDTRVKIPLKGHGLEVMLTDEAFLKELEDQDLGEGPLIVSGVFVRCHGRDCYAGKLPHGLACEMSQGAVRKLLGPPNEKDDDIPVDIWKLKKPKLELVINYAPEGKSIANLSLMLPGAE